MSQLEVDKIIPQSGTTLTIGDSGDTITVASGATLTGDLNADNLTSGTVPSARISGAYTGITQTGTLTSFASTGIDDNATSTAITIDSSNRVSIRATSTTRDFQVGDTSGATTMEIESASDSSGTIFFGDAQSGASGRILYDHTDNYLRLDTNGSERMRIDSSGNLLVGTTSIGFSDTGAELRATGQASLTVDGNACAFMNRLTSDGRILEFSKDGTTVGSIFSRSGVVSGIILDPRAGGNGLLGQAGSIIPVDETQTREDNATDLGNSTYRYKDLYLGGGLYVGGTGTANKLDDYEEGDWTPGYTAASGTPVYNVRAGSYTKVGRKVTVTGAVSGARGSLSGDVTISGLPFSCASASKFSNSVSLMGEDWNATFSFKGRVQNNNNVIQLYKEATNTSGFVGVNQGDMKSGAAQDNYVQFTATYFTT